MADTTQSAKQKICKLPSVERVRELFDYDPSTGLLTRRIDAPGLKFKIGAVVGTRNSHGHLICRVHYTIYYVHRLVWLHFYGRTPPALIDHINGIRDDNRICNLRLADIFESSRNRRHNRNSASGLKGAHYSTSEGKWRSSIGVNGCVIHLGWFETKEEAARAYAEAALRYHREFASTD